MYTIKQLNKILIKSEKENSNNIKSYPTRFDRVWHGALLSKLSSYGIPEGLCTWLSSFLDGRSIRVAVDGCCSSAMPINADVPQGCVYCHRHCSSSISMICCALITFIAMRMTLPVTLDTPAVQIYPGQLWKRVGWDLCLKSRQVQPHEDTGLRLFC